MPSQLDPRPTSSLARYLQGDATSEPALEELGAAGLIGHAFTRLPQHPQRAQLRDGFLFLAARHVASRRAVVDLVKAWNETGLTPFVFKGFHVAEFVYPAPGHRSYADVDLVVAEEDVDTACRVAIATGWEVDWRIGLDDDLHALHGPEYLGHEAAHLHHDELDLKIDLHRRAVPNVHNNVAPPLVTRRLTEAVLEAAATVTWEGARLRIPDPVDAVVFGLALNRCWGSDGWWIKPRDYADFEALAEHFGVTRRAVMARASSLGVAHTVGVFLDRCDPQHGRLDLRRPSWFALRRWEAGGWRERGFVAVVRGRMWLQELTRDILTLARVIPVVADTRRRVRRGDDLVAGRLTAGRAPAPRHVGSLAWRSLRRALRRSMRLLRVAPDERPRLTVLTAYRVLRSRGLPVELDLGSATSDKTPALSLGGRIVNIPVVDTPAA